MFLCSFLFGQEYQINMTNSEDTKIAQIWKISSFMKIYACNGDGHMNPFVSLTSLELLCVLRPVLESQLLRLRPTHCLQGCSLLGNSTHGSLQGLLFP